MCRLINVHAFLALAAWELVPIGFGSAWEFFKLGLGPSCEKMTRTVRCNVVGFDHLMCLDLQ